MKKLTSNPKLPHYLTNIGDWEELGPHLHQFVLQSEIVYLLYKNQCFWDVVHHDYHLEIR